MEDKAHVMMHSVGEKDRWELRETWERETAVLLTAIPQTEEFIISEVK